MIGLFWAGLAAIAIIWPARLAGPLDGAPLDRPLEAIVLGLLLPWMFVAAPKLLKRRDVRLLIVALLAWKAVSGQVFTREGWCLRFTSPVPVFVDDVRVPHSWDVRADWRSDVPQCSAIMTGNYSELERFPVWFYNLPPANFRDPVRPGDRPPGATLRLDLTGYLHAPSPATLQMQSGEDMTLSATVDGLDLTHQQLHDGVALSAGDHDVHVRGDLRRSHWSLDLRFDNASMWQSALATTTRPGALDVRLHSLAKYIPTAIVFSILAIGASVMTLEAPLSAVAGVLMCLPIALLASLGREGLTRLLPLMLVIPAGIAAWKRQRSHLVHALVIGLPFLAIFIALGWPRAGLFTWYSSGDDWWMFQRFSYRVFMQGHWIEGGEKAFYNQPLYRWIAGALHMVFGDSSVGELFWDAAAALTGAVFAFQLVKAAANARWAWAASLLTLVVFVLGPTWYLIGRGMSEFSSAGFLYGAALCVMRARSGSRWCIPAAGVLASLGFYARLNNAPMALALALFALPTALPATAWRAPAQLWRRFANPVSAGVILAIAIAVQLYSLRTWYYTGVYDMFFGSSARTFSIFRRGEPVLQSMLSSLLTMLSMQDTPQFDVRALPLFFAAAASVLALLGVWRFAKIPLSAAGFCLAGVSAGLVVRGESYPGRFSVHLVPICAAVTVCAIFCLFDKQKPDAEPS